MSDVVRRGRKPKDMLYAEAKQSLYESLGPALQLIKKINDGDILRPNPQVVDNAWRTVYQIMGKPPQRHEIEGRVEGIVLTIKYEENNNKTVLEENNAKLPV